MTTIEAPPAPRRISVAGRNVLIVSREEFRQRYWEYGSGEHVTFLGPTGCGKTTLAYQLLEYSTSPARPGIVFVMKPRDTTVTKWTRLLHYRRVRSWPPMWESFRGKPPGYVLWPKHSFDVDKDDAVLESQFRKALRDSYKRGNRIVFGDEVYGMCQELNLTRDVVVIWTRGRSMDCGLWAATQKPTHIPLWAYSMASHLFLYNDPDKRALDRFGEIGGVDPDLLRAIVRGLSKHQVLYVRRDGPVMCIIDK